jgi:hypothetical protein
MPAWPLSACSDRHAALRCAGVALPSMNNLVANAVPPSQKATALGSCFTGFHTGAPLPEFIGLFALRKGLVYWGLCVCVGGWGASTHRRIPFGCACPGAGLSVAWPLPVRAKAAEAARQPLCCLGLRARRHCCGGGAGTGPLRFPARHSHIRVHTTHTTTHLPLSTCPCAGNLVGLLSSPLILQHFGWRALFALFGALGAPLLALWWLVVPDPGPAQRARQQEGEPAAAVAGRQKGSLSPAP